MWEITAVTFSSVPTKWAYSLMPSLSHHSPTSIFSNSYNYLSSSTSKCQRQFLLFVVPPVSPLCFLLRNKVLMHLYFPPSKRCPFQWLMEINSQSLSEGALGSDGTCLNTVAARAGGGCSAQRATTSGTKSHTFFLLLENLPLKVHFGSVENKQKQCCLPEIIAPVRSRKGAKGKNSGCFGARTSWPLTGLSKEV